MPLGPNAEQYRCDNNHSPAALTTFITQIAYGPPEPSPVATQPSHKPSRRRHTYLLALLLKVRILTHTLNTRPGHPPYLLLVIDPRPTTMLLAVPRNREEALLGVNTTTAGTESELSDAGFAAVVVFETIVVLLEAEEAFALEAMVVLLAHVVPGPRLVTRSRTGALFSLLLPEWMLGLVEGRV